MAESTDLELVERTLAGEHYAFSVLVERHQVGVRRQVAVLTPPWVDRDSIVQEAFLFAYEKLGQLRDREQFKSWVYRIATNHARTWVRRQLRQPELTGFSVEHQEEQDPLPEVPPHDPVMMARLRGAFAHCSAIQRDVLLHHYVRGLSYRQTALALKCRPNAVRSRLQKARRRLRKVMREMTTKHADENVLQFDRNTLRDLRAATVVCANDSHPTKALQGVLLSKKGKLVGTDGKHMVIRHCPEAMKLSADAAILGCRAEDVPDVETASFIVGLTEAVLRVDGREERRFAVSEEPYPEYRQAIPDSWRYKMCLSRQDLDRGMAEMQSYLAPRHPSKEGCSYTPLVELLLNVPDQELVIRASESLGYDTHEQRGDNGRDIAMPLWEHRVTLRGSVKVADGASDDSVLLCLNYEYLCHVTSDLGEREQSDLELLIVSPDHPVVVRSLKEPNNLGAVMPVRMS